MAKSQLVTVFREQLARIFSGVSMRNAMMKVNLHLAPTGVAMVGEHLDQALVILFGGIKVSVEKRSPVVVAPFVDSFRIFARPPFQAALLLGAWGALLAVFGNDGWFKMIG